MGVARSGASEIPDRNPPTKYRTRDGIGKSVTRPRREDIRARDAATVAQLRLSFPFLRGIHGRHRLLRTHSPDTSHRETPNIPLVVHRGREDRSDSARHAQRRQSRSFWLSRKPPADKREHRPPARTSYGCAVGLFPAHGKGVLPSPCVFDRGTLILLKRQCGEHPSHGTHYQREASHR